MDAINIETDTESTCRSIEPTMKKHKFKKEDAIIKKDVIRNRIDNNIEISMTKCFTAFYPDVFEAHMPLAPPDGGEDSHVTDDSPVSLLSLSSRSGSTECDAAKSVSTNPESSISFRGLLHGLAGSARPAQRELLFDCHSRRQEEYIIDNNS
jgi:hypothetical protein